MCGRYTLTVDLNALQSSFDIDVIAVSDWNPRYNIAPTQNLPVIYNEGGQRRLELFRWGLIPFWADDKSIGSRMINARAETVDSKPSFRAAFKYRRCLIPTDGFYEWQAQNGGPKIPMYFRREDKEPFAFAGLWEEWNKDDEIVRSYTIITTQPNDIVRPIHNRMPAILPPDAYECWLNTSPESAKTLKTLLLEPFPSDPLETYPVSRDVNNPQNDSPHIIRPA
jgi:putative SOS response-associated peptidase YedK